MKTGIVMDKRYMEHDMGSFHVESPKRLEVIYRMIEKDISFPYKTLEPRSATESEIEMVHPSSYLKTIKQTAGKDRVVLDPDTSTSARSYEVALLAAGGLLKAAELVMEGAIQNGFALVRPPGHHAEASRAMGFCLFNNVAIGAEYLLQKHGLQRILIVDWDLHHGNGTQHSFYDRNDVLYFSTHQYPHYPGTGRWDEVGRNAGEGYTVNVPLSYGVADEGFLYIFKEILSPIAALYKPEFILVSAGFDIYKDDPLGGMMVSGPGFGAMTSVLMDLAHRFCDDRLLFTLEGGYDLNGLEQGVKHVLTHLAGQAGKVEVEAQCSPVLEKMLSPVFETQRKHWNF